MAIIKKTARTSNKVSSKKLEIAAIAQEALTSIAAAGLDLNAANSMDIAAHVDPEGLVDTDTYLEAGKLVDAALMGPHLPAGWTSVETSVSEEADAAEPASMEPASTALVVIPSLPRVSKLPVAKPSRVVMLTFPLIVESPVYLDLTTERGKVSFDKRSLDAWTVDNEAKMASITIARSMAIRKQLIAA